jgi:hypothetical protein
MLQHCSKSQIIIDLLAVHIQPETRDPNSGNTDRVLAFAIYMFRLFGIDQKPLLLTL